MRKTSGIRSLLKKVVKLDLGSFLLETYGVNTNMPPMIDCVQKCTVSMVQLQQLLVDQNVLDANKGAQGRRPLYTIINICYAAGLLIPVISSSTPKRYMWNKNALQSIFPENTLWFNVSITNNGIATPDRSIKKHTQNLLAYLSTKKKNKKRKRKKMSTGELATASGVKQRRIYEIITVLTYMGIVQRRNDAYLVHKKSYDNTKYHMPILMTPSQSFVSDVETRSQKRRRKEQQEAHQEQFTTVWDDLAHFTYDPVEAI